MNKIYTFVFRGLLADASLDKIGRKQKKLLRDLDISKLQEILSFEKLEQDFLIDAQHMSIVYTAIHTFENMVRHLVGSVMQERFGEKWWNKVPSRIQKRVKLRISEETKFRIYEPRGATEIHYADFADLSSIIANNTEIFEEILGDITWAKVTLDLLGKSRNIIMHSGVLDKRDIERIGWCIRDWIKQTGWV